MLVAPEHIAERRTRARPSRHRRGEETFLGPLQPQQRIVYPRERNAAIFDGVDERFERRGLRFVIAAADQQAVAPGLDGQDRRGRYGVLSRNGLHFEVVAEDHPAVAQFLAQEIGDYTARQCRGSIFVERWHQYVRRHDRCHVGLDGGPERHELDGSQAIGWVLHERQLEVRIHARVAMTREMLPARRHALGLERHQYEEALGEAVAEAYQAEFTRRAPFYAAAVDVIVGGWHMMWPEDDFFLPREMRLLATTIRDAEPCREIWLSESGNISVKERIT